MIRKFLILILTVFCLLSCSKNKDFTTTELGFSFKRCTKNDTTPKAQKGDVIFGQMKILLNNKQELFSCYNSPTRLFIIGEGNIGSIDEFLQTLHIGDSAIMIVPADSLIQYTNNIVTKKEDKIYVYLTINQLISQKEITGLENEEQERREKEKEELTNYVLNHYERALQKESGLFFLQTKESNGKQAEYGKRLYVNYAVMDTNGKIYDSNIEEVAKKGGIYQPQKLYKPFDFILGDDALIAGWSEGVSYMKVGSQAILIIPSHLAYGNEGFGSIKPNTPLIFEITLLKVENEN